MKTIVHIETTDEQREVLAAKLGGKKMISRKEVTDLVQTYIARLITEEDYGPNGYMPPPDAFADEAPQEPAPAEPEASRDRSVRAFVPSRGDEEYLYRGKDPELTAACSSVLDACEHLDQVIWRKLEENRE